MVSIWSLDIRRWTHWGQALTPATINVMANKNIWKQIRKGFIESVIFLKIIKCIYLLTDDFIFTCSALNQDCQHPISTQVMLTSKSIGVNEFWQNIQCVQVYSLFWILYLGCQMFLTQLQSLPRGEIPMVI